MTVLADGTVVDESINAANYTLAANCPAAFGYQRIISSITIHHWGNLGQDFDAVVAYLASANPRQSSAHAIIKGGRATSIVSPENAAWHAGNAYGSATSIGLELRPEATDADYRTAGAYIHMLRGIYGDLPLIPHNHWTTTACPGVWNLARLDDEARAYDEQPTEQGNDVTPEQWAKMEAWGKKVDAMHDAVFRNDGKNSSIIGGLSIPGLINTNDVLIRQDIADLKKAIVK